MTDACSGTPCRALTLGAPPRFDGIRCSLPGCDRRYYVEQDHINPIANGGPTAVENMRPVCWLHHLIKTDKAAKPAGCDQAT